MAKTSNFLLVFLAMNLLFGLSAAVICTADNEINLENGECISADLCTGYIYPDKTKCYQQCPEESNIGTVSFNGASYDNGCVYCNNFHVSSDLKTCQEYCQHEIMQVGQQRCLSSVSDCKTQLSQDQTTCGSNICLNEQTALEISSAVYKLCACPEKLPIFDAVNGKCATDCSYTLWPDTQTCNYEFLCFDNMYFINGGSYCGLSCPDKKTIPVQLVNSNSKICRYCPDEKPIANSQQNDCGFCEGKLIADSKTHSCLDSNSKCTDNNAISEDGKLCGKSCPSKYYKKQLDGYKQCTLCDKYVSLDKLACLDTCPLVDLTPPAPTDNKVKCLEAYSECQGVLSTDKSLCLESCPEGQMPYDQDVDGQKYKLCQLCPDNTPYYQVLDGQGSCVNTCDSSLILFFEEMVCKLKSSCTKNLSSNKRACLSSCNSEFVNDPVINTPYLECTAECEQGKYQMTLNSVQYCTATCPDGMFKKDSLCLSSKKDCPNVISSDFKNCATECNSNNKETAVQMTGYKLCSVCIGYFIDKTNSEPSKCLQSCPADQVAVVTTKTCVAKDQAATACTGLLMSVDGSSCKDTCTHPDIFYKLDNKCVATCPDGKNTDESQSVLTCIASSDCARKLSSDQKKCVDNCSLIGELAPQTGSNKCQSCGKQNYYYDSSLRTGQCKKDHISNSELNITLTQILHIPFPNQKQADTMKQQINTYASSSINDLGAKKDNKAVIQNIEKLAQSFLTQSSSLSSTYDPQAIGDKAALRTNFQNVKTGRKPYYNLKISSLLSDTTSDLTELMESNKDTQYSSVIYSVLASNPTCSTQNCKYPLISIKSATSSNRLLQDSTSQFTVEYSVTTVSSNYVCLTYDLTKNIVINSYNTPSISADGLTVICPVNGATTLFLDSSCHYIDSSKCTTPQNPVQPINTANSDNSDSSDGLSAGGVVGVVIGSVAFGLIVGAGSFFLYQKLHQKKQEKKEAKYIEPPLTSSDA